MKIEFARFEIDSDQTAIDQIGNRVDDLKIAREILFPLFWALLGLPPPGPWNEDRVRAFENPPRQDRDRPSGKSRRRPKEHPRISFSPPLPRLPADGRCMRCAAKQQAPEQFCSFES